MLDFTRTGRILSLLLILMFASVTFSFVSLTSVSAVGVVDQHWDPAHPGTGNAIKFHSPIGQSFMPALDNMVGVDVSIQNQQNLDQSLTTSTGWNWINLHMPIGQSFKPTNPLFTRFSVYLENTAAASRTIQMNLRSGSIGGAILGSKSFTIAGPAAAGWSDVDMASPVAVTIGSTYVIQLIDSVGGVRWYGNSGAVYADGAAITDGSPSATYDYLFRTYGASDSVTANIRSGTIGGLIIATATRPVPLQSFTWTHIDFTQFSVTPGGVYVLELIEPGKSMSWEASAGGGYVGGTAIYNGVANAGFDNLFRTYGVPAAFDFSIALTTPASITVTQGGTASWGVQVNLVSGATQPVTLALAGGLPAGVTPNTPITNSPSFAATVTIATAGSTPTGTYPLIITASGGAVTHSVTITLIVNPAGPTPDFSVSVSPGTLTIAQGGSSTTTTRVTSIGSFSSPVTLSAPGAPAGITVSFGTNPVTPPAGGSVDSSTSVSVPSSTATGSYSVTIRGTSGATTHDTTLTVQVTSAVTPDFSIAASPSSLTLNQGGSATSTITVTSLNAFNSAVALSYSWLGSAPGGVSINLPGPITPPSGSTATSTLTVSASSSASTGSFTLSIDGTSGSLTHSVSVGITITSGAAITTTTTTPAGPACIIATATYGSELAPEVQLLRGFRDNSILRTVAGSSFMTAFNAWYYSFSPTVADYLTQHPAERAIMKIALYPLIGILAVSSATFEMTSFVPELAALLSGLVASSLIGAFYLGLPFGLVRAKIRGFKGGKRERLFGKALALVLLSGMAALFLGEIVSSMVLLMLSSTVVVLSTMFLVAVFTSAKICRTLAK